MDVQPIDQGALLRSGQAAVPNYAEQAMQRALLGVQQQNAQTGALNAQTIASTRQRDVQRQDQFSQAVQAAGNNPTAEQLAMLAYRFPEFSEALRRGWQTLDEGTRRRDFQAVANITSAARGAAIAARRGDTAAADNGYALATQLMRQRVDADRAAGHEDSMDTAILTALQDPSQRQYAVDLLERATSSADPERYSQTYGTFQRRTKEVDGILIDEDTGEAIGQSPYDRVRFGPNGEPITFHPVPGLRRFGVDPMGGGEPPQQQPAAGIPQTPSVAPAFGGNAPLTVDDISTQFPADNPNTPGREAPRAIDTRAMPSGDPRDSHLAQQPGSQIVRISSRQQYDALPRGAQYIDPQGHVRTKQ